MSPQSRVSYPQHDRGGHELPGYKMVDQPAADAACVRMA